MFKKLFQSVTHAPAEQKRNLIFLCLSYFFVLFNYPLMRATTTAMYMQAYGGSASPIIWLYSVVALAIIITIYNKLQNKVGVHLLFHYTTFLSVVIFLASLFLFNQGITAMAGVLYVWKEVYIVILVHLILGYCNSTLKYEEAKEFFGPLGAMGSIGGILGGFLTSVMTKPFGVDVVIYLGCIGLLINAFCFHFTSKSGQPGEDKKSTSKESPLHSIKGASRYVFLIALIVTMSQFCINIANLKFDLVFAQMVPDQETKATYLGTLFSLINVATLIIQFILIPPLFKYRSNKFTQYLIPSSYLILSLLGLGIGSSVLALVAGTFLFMKAFDYSLFTASKELLYYPLDTLQKYGAKYVSDMVVYRLSKGLIAVILIKYQDFKTLNLMMGISLVIWFIALFYLFKDPHSTRTIHESVS